jgi:hypothetical protein
MGNFSEDEMRDESLTVAHIATLVEKLITAPEKPAAFRLRQLHRYESSKLPRISIFEYLERLRKLAHFDTSFLIALIYIDRLLAMDSNFAVTPRNVHRLLFTCATVAEKFLEDTFYCNSYYAQVGGISLAEMNRLEMTLLYTMNWRLGVSPEEFDEKRQELRRAATDMRSKAEDTEWIEVKESVSEKVHLDGHSEATTPATTMSGSQTESFSDFTESWDSSSEDDEGEDESMGASPEIVVTCLESGSLEKCDKP